MPPRTISSRTPRPSGLMTVAQLHSRRSIALSIERLSPCEVGHISPVKVCMRLGTPAKRAASIHIRPALGVIECTSQGLSRRISLYIRHSERKSLSGAMCRCMGTPIVRTPGRCDMRSSASSGFDTTTISYLSTRYGSIGAQKDSSELPMVVARIILGFEPSEALDLFIIAGLFGRMLRRHFPREHPKECQNRCPCTLTTRARDVIKGLFTCNPV